MQIKSYTNQNQTAATWSRSKDSTVKFMQFRQFYRWGYAGILLLLLNGACVTSLEPGVTLNPAPLDDSDYAPILEQHTVKYELISNFETRYQIAAVNLSGEFMKAFAKRYERLFNDPQPILEEAATRAGFFVTLFASNRDLRDLGDDRVWNIQMERDMKTLKPIMVKQLPQKERWHPFFPSVNLWTKEYLVVFDAPPPDSGAKALLKEAKVRLIFANADAKIVTGW